jgi:hypothetical protein
MIDERERERERERKRERVREREMGIQSKNSCFYIIFLF